MKAGGIMLDFIFGTENEKKRDNYKKKVRKLTEYKSDLDKLISDYDDYVSYLPFKFEDTYALSNELYGDAVDLFFERSKEAKDSIDKCREKLKAMSDEIGIKIAKANELYSYYSDKVTEEEAKEKKSNDL
jgi:hypothetical protein